MKIPDMRYMFNSLVCASNIVLLDSGLFLWFKKNDELLNMFVGLIGTLLGSFVANYFYYKKRLKHGNTKEG